MKTLQEVREIIRAARCPECGREVFAPKVANPRISDDPIVWCRDFGHWEGKLSECVNALESLPPPK